MRVGEEGVGSCYLQGEKEVSTKLVMITQMGWAFATISLSEAITSIISTRFIHKLS